MRLHIDVAIGIIICLAVIGVCIAEYFHKSNREKPK
jgi:hypothetical protein